ncbi:PQQ-binding-like beta-propeller repeat protein [Haloarchaeobius sp. HME9146]|uniref:PQQ-binding-like beta-propeller repeat protein n=1 Tax=Haloarchaeobius sp. HME9146 TaxID=2978732 RepID=UPI0021C084DA|nr:PQQ-binding-like beta-propeller repeat protein [Haloarchaeobius sp. HME9146]MCT9094474.1 PQQ-binding-like beta-propeller repeat protein [Haloarchaeobius sp. HME9146]
MTDWFPSRRRFLLSCATVGLSGCSALQADPPAPGPGDWTHPRSDAARTGHSPVGDLREQPSVAWRIDLEHVGAPNAAATLFDGTLYHPDGGFLAVDATDGTVRARGTETTFSAPVVAPTAAYRNETLVFGGAGTVTGANPSGTVPGDLRQRWRFPGPPGESLFPSFAAGADEPGPAVADGTVYWSGPVSGDDSLVAIDASSGRKHWHVTAENGLHEPVVADGAVFAGNLADVVVAVDHDGTERWRVRRDIRFVDWNRFVADDERLYLARSEHVAALDTTTGEEVWSQALTARNGTRPALADGTLFVGVSTEEEASDALVALDAATGEQRWSVPAGSHDRPPVVAGETLYQVDYDTIVARDVTDGTERWRWTNPTEDQLAVPTPSDRRLYVPALRELLALEVPT